MSNPLEEHRGTSQFLDRKVEGPDGEMVDDITRRPDKHSGRSVRMGLEATFTAGNTHGIGRVTPGEVAEMSPKKLARLTGRVERVRKARSNSALSDNKTEHVGLDEETEVGHDDAIADFRAVEDPIAYSSRPPVQSTIGDAVKTPAFAVDVLTLFREQSFMVAGDQTILEEELVDRVDGIDGSTVSLEAFRDAEAEAEAQELFDYGTTAEDLRQ